MLKYSAVALIFLALAAHTIFAGVLNTIDDVENLNDAVLDLNVEGPPAVHSAKAKCYLRYSCFKRRRYYFENLTKRTRDDALFYCSTLNMSLVSVEDCEENTFIVNSIIASSCAAEDYWTSGYQTGNNVFFWGTGARFNFTTWKSDNPTLGKNRNCVYYRNDYLQWKDQTCNNKYFFICESNLPCL